MPWSLNGARAAFMHFVNVLGANLVLVSLSPKGKPEELPVMPSNLNMKIGILQVNSDKPVSCTNSVT